MKNVVKCGLSQPQVFHHRVRQLLLGLCAGFGATLSWADEHITALPDMTVYGELVAANEVDLATQPGFVSVIKREEFAGTLSTVADILKSEPGIQVRETGGLGSFSTVSLRGSSSQQVNVFLDGVLLNNVVSGTVDLSRISLGQVESVEIYRGAAPIQLGSSNIGGAINIKTRKTPSASGSVNEQTSGEIVVGGGSFNSKKTDAALSQQFGKLRVAGSVGYQASDNDFEFTNDNQTEFNPNDDSVEKRHNNATEMANALLSFDYSLDNDQSLQLRAQHHSKDQQIPDVFNSADTTSKLDTVLTQIQLQFADQHWREGSYATSVFYAQSEEHFYDEQGRIGIGKQNEKANTDAVGASLNGNQLVGEHLLAASLELKQDDYRNQQLLGTIETQNFQRQSALLGLQDDVTLWSNESLLQVGIRLQHIHDEGELPSTESKPNVDDRETYLSWHSGFRWDMNPELTFKSNLSKGIRVPRLSEKFGDRGLFIGNPELVEEKAINLDAGVAVTRADWVLNSALFYRWLDDAIVATYDSRGVGRFENISKALIYGAEFDFVYAINDWLTLDGKATLQDTENTSDNPDQHGKQLAGHYQQAYSLSAISNYQNYTLEFEYAHESGGYYDSAEARAIPDKDLLNATLQWHLDYYAGTTVTLEANNLTDEAFEAFNGYPSPGRNFFISLAQAF